MGLRLAGIDGSVVEDFNAYQSIMNDVLKDPSIGVILLTTKVFDLDRENLLDLKLNQEDKLIVEISDRHGSFEVQDMIRKTLAQIIGDVV